MTFEGSSSGSAQPEARTGSVNLNQEVKLYQSSRDREDFDNRANLFSIIQTIQALEIAYIKDAVSPKDYHQACSKLLEQSKAAFGLVKQSFKDVEEFMKRYHVECPAALQRIKDGKPLAVHEENRNESRLIADVVSMFLTLLDRLRLDIMANDQLQPDVKDLLDAMDKMRSLPKDFEGRKAVQGWLDVLKNMSASDELTPDQARQMVFDIEGAYNDFNKFLG